MKHPCKSHFGYIDNAAKNIGKHETPMILMFANETSMQTPMIPFYLFIICRETNTHADTHKRERNVLTQRYNTTQRYITNFIWKLLYILREGATSYIYYIQHPWFLMLCKLFFFTINVSWYFSTFLKKKKKKKKKKQTQTQKNKKNKLRYTSSNVTNNLVA